MLNAEMSASPRISIITPCHNGLPYLPMMLDSVSAQTLSAWEHIVVDDGSTDASASIVEERMRSEPRLRLLRKSQGGVALARAAGYRASSPSTDYVYFLDADDLLEPDRLATMIDYLDRRPRVGVAYCDFRCVDENGNEVAKDGAPRYVPGWLGVRQLAPDEPQTPLVSIFSWAPVMESVSVIRRSVYARSPGWDPAIGQPGEGVDLFAKIALTSEVHFVNRTLYSYRRHAVQASRDWRWIAKQDLKVQRKWRDRQDLTPEERAAIDRAQTFRVGRLRMHQALTAARRYFARGELRHAVSCCADACRTLRHRVVGASPWPADQ